MLLRVREGHIWWPYQYVSLKGKPILTRMEKRQRPSRFVLVVEDEQRDAELIKELLQECEIDIAVDIATNAVDDLTSLYAITVSPA
jgi:hypothetical protein